MRSEQTAGVLNEVARERARQDAKWGGAAHDDEHSPLEWGLFMTDRLHVLMNERGAAPDEQRRALIEAAALAVAAIEAHDRRGGRQTQ